MKRLQLPSFTSLEALLLGLIAIAGGCLWAFAQLTDEVLEGDTHSWDTAILLALRTPGDNANPLGPQWLEIFMRDATSLGSYAVLWIFIIAAMLYLFVKGRPWRSLLLGSVVGSAALANNLLKLGFNRPRPDVVAHVAEVYTASFPSGHAMLSAVTYLTLGAFLAGIEDKWPLRAFWLGFAVFLTLLVGFSRIYLGVHYPTDVLAGWSLGATWALTGMLIIHGLRLHKRWQDKT